MSKYYIGGVATVAAFANGEHMFTAKTLTDSSINISVSSEEIRGGEGAQLLGKFFHTTVFNLSLTDALFDLRYIAGQVGSDMINADAVTWKTAKPSQISVSGGTVSLTLNAGETLAEIDFDTGKQSGYYAWCEQIEDGGTFKLSGGSPYTFTIDADEAKKFEDGEYCLSYPITANGTQLTVNAMYYPGVFSLIMRAKLFAGDACKISDGKPVGEVVIEIPRFQLDGTIDLAMAMTSPSTYALNGSALANGCGCDEDAWYAKITQVIFGADPYAGYTGIVVDDDTLVENETIGVYAFAIGKTPKALEPGMYTSSNTSVIALNGKVMAAGTTTITANGANLANTSAIYNEAVTVTIPE